MDDIIFVGSSHALVAKFAKTMSREFDMSMMGEVNFFLGLLSVTWEPGVPESRGQDSRVPHGAFPQGLLPEIREDQVPGEGARGHEQWSSSTRVPR